MASSTRDRRLLRSRPFGGDGGTRWDDVRGVSTKIVGIHKIDIRHGNQVDAIRVTYRLADGSTYLAPAHGGSGGEQSSFTLAEDEKIVCVVSKTNKVLVDQIKFVTKNSAGEKKSYGPFGKTGETSVIELEGEVVGFFGRSGNLLDALGIYYYSPENDKKKEKDTTDTGKETMNQSYHRIVIFSLIVVVVGIVVGLYCTL